MRWLLLALLASGCKHDDPGLDDTEVVDDTDDTDGPSDPTVCSPRANLEIVPLDIWGRDLEHVEVHLDRDARTLADPSAGPGVLLLPLGPDPVELSLYAEALQLASAGLTVTWTGDGGADGFAITEPTSGARAVTSWGARTLQGISCPVYSVYLGLDHPWFAASGRAPSGNDVTFLMDGEETWSAVYDDVAAAKTRVTWTTWWWESKFELVRPADHAWTTESERQPYTAMGLLDSLPGVERRILVNRFWGENTDYNQYLNTDTTLRDRAQTSGDRFEVVLQGNPTEVPVAGQFTGEAARWSFGQRVLDNPRYQGRSLVIDDRRGAPRDVAIDAASWHQKAVVVDGRVAYVSGMNTKGTDWDSNDHLVFDERRMEFDATTADRLAVRDREELPDLGPRKDYAMRVSGPAAHDVEDILHGRWEEALATGALYADRATPFSLLPPPADVRLGTQTQVVATLPAPWSEMSILETHRKAIEQAREYVYIEDQYFRAPLLLDALVARMNEDPDLVVIVVTKPISDYDPGAKFTHLGDATLRSLFPDRYVLLQLRSVDMVAVEGVFWDDVYLYAQDVDTHSKIRIVDDTYLSVGSCNFNNRGYLFEGELDVAVVDPVLARAARRRVLRELVGPDWAPWLSDDPQNNLDVLRMVAADNAEVLAWWEANAGDLDAPTAESTWASYRPSGFVYPLTISADYAFEVGPDVF